MKKIIFIIAFIFILLAGISIAIYHFVDINDYKDDIIALVKKNTGKDINIKGDIRIRILPDIAIDINDISMKPSIGDESEDSVAIEQLVLHLKLIPLIKKQIEVSSLKIVKPVVVFKIFKDGTNNFTKATQTNKNNQDKISNHQQKTNDKQNINETINNLLGKIELSSIYIEEAKIRFINLKQGLDIFADKMSLKTSLSKGPNSINISGDLDTHTGIKVPFSLKGNYELAENFYNMSDLDISFGNINTHGEFGVDYRSVVPDIKIAFYFDEADLNPYLNFFNVLTAENAPIDNTSSNIAQNKGSNIISTNKQQPFMWSDKPIDFSALRLFNGHFSFKANKIIYKQTSIGGITMNAYLRNGKLTISIKEAEVVGGNIHGESTLDITSSIPKIRNKINIEEADLSKLPINSGSFLSNIEGKVSGGFNLSSRGLSQRDIINNLNGNISVKASDGAVKGIDLVGMAKNITTAFLVGKTNEQKTVFKEISGDFEVNNGTATSDNITFNSDIIDFNGSMSVDLPALTINSRLLPKVKRLKDESDVLGGVRAPILITGSLLQPSFRLEIQTLVGDLIKNPKGTENLVKQLKRDFNDVKNNMKKGIDGNNTKDPGEMINDFKNILNGL